MTDKKTFDWGGIRFLPRAFLAWLLAAFFLLLLASLIVSRSGLGSGAMGYISSALSFLAAVFAGAQAARTGGGKRLTLGAAAGFAISLLLLTLGFLIAGSGMSASGILSVVSFSFVGCLVGAVFFGGSSGSGKQNRFSQQKRTPPRGFHK